MLVVNLSLNSLWDDYFRGRPVASHNALLETIEKGGVEKSAISWNEI